MVNGNNVNGENGCFTNSSGSSTNMADRYANNTIGYEKISIAQVVKSLTPATYGNAVRATLSVEGANIRISTGANVPTTTDGILILANSIISLECSEISNFKAIAPTGTAIINVEYKR